MTSSELDLLMQEAVGSGMPWSYFLSTHWALPLILENILKDMINDSVDLSWSISMCMALDA